MSFGKSRAALLAAFVTVAGCDCNKTSAQIQARHAMVATVLATPAFSVPYQGIAGLPFFDGGIPSFDGGGFTFDGGCPFDGGCVFDAGELPISLGEHGLEVKPQTALFAFFGTREGDGLTTAPTPVDGAMLKVEGGAGTWALKSLGSGVHELSTAEDSTLVYDAGVTWTFTASADSIDYEGGVVDAPAAEHILQLHPDAGFISLAAGTDYQLTRPDPEPGVGRLLGFVTVFPISASGRQGEATYTNVPTTPLGFLKLVAAPSDFKKTVVTIPGSAFPEVDRNYLIIMQSAKVGGASSDNLFIGSAVIAGVADLGVVRTR
ncbi:MAG: hypothetical protein IPJ65_32960 [Archangiaceae bacterium]|nr:hypothetical protein [Archangiaceae bacterium]